MGGSSVNIDFTRCRLPPYEHQKIGTLSLVLWDQIDIGRVIGGCFFNTDEMGVGKTKQVIDAMMNLYEMNVIDKVIVVAPAPVRTGVWFDSEFGELAAHLWNDVPSKIVEFHSRIRSWTHGPTVRPGARHLEWYLTNYEFIRNKDRLKQLTPATGARTYLVLDESSAIKNYRASQTKSCMVLRSKCGRVTELNGTPIANAPNDLYSQARILDKKILDCDTYFHFIARHGVKGGFMSKQIVGWTNLEDLQRRLAPYVIRRLKKDCLDIPPKPDHSIILSARLTDESWRVYKQMRDEMVAWLSASTVSVSQQAVVKSIRLAQITSGFLGGIVDPGVKMWDELDLTGDDAPDDDRPAWLPPRTGQPIAADLLGLKAPPGIVPAGGRALPPQEIGREKLDVLLEWLDQQLIADPQLRVLIWCRFRAELARIANVILTKPIYNYIHFGQIHGGQKRDERSKALQLLDPRQPFINEPIIVAGTPSSGSMGLNLAGAHTVIYVSNDFSLKTRLQSEDRVHRPGQRHVVSYFDIIAEGPRGQRTIDHQIQRALRNKEDIANWTTKEWVTRLKEE